MTKLGTLYRKYLRGSDLTKPALVKILTCAQVQVLPNPAADPTVKWCLFVEGVRDFPDGVPNGILFGPKSEERLAEIFGKVDISELAGKQVVIYPEQIKVGRDQKMAIRFRAPKNGVPEPPAQEMDVAIESLLD